MVKTRYRFKVILSTGEKTTLSAQGVTELDAKNMLESKYTGCRVIGSIKKRQK